jgi:hypothetical protein
VAHVCSETAEIAGIVVEEHCSLVEEAPGPCQKIHICLGLAATATWNEMESCTPHSAEEAVSGYKLAEYCTQLVSVALGCVREWHMPFAAQAGRARVCCMLVGVGFERSPELPRDGPWVAEAGDPVLHSHILSAFVATPSPASQPGLVLHLWDRLVMASSSPSPSIPLVLPVTLCLPPPQLTLSPLLSLSAFLALASHHNR